MHKIEEHWHRQLFLTKHHVHKLAIPPSDWQTKTLVYPSSFDPLPYCRQIFRCVADFLRLNLLALSNLAGVSSLCYW